MITAIGLLLFVVIGCAAVLVDRSRAEAARLRLLVELSEKLQLSPSIHDATQLIPGFATRLFPNLEGALYVSRNSSSDVKLAVTWNEAREEDSLSAASCNALMLGTTHLMTARAESICEHSEMNTDSETICIPMIDAEESFGLLILRAPSRSPLPPGIECLAKSFTQQVALALSNLRLQETLHAAAVRDSLTGLYNRRCIAESLTLELLGGGDPNARVGVILIDVDHFKKFNDTWGHGGGDALLQKLARLMQQVFAGEDDIICRYGGEEFVVVLPNVSPAVVRMRADQLLRRVRDLQINCDGRVVSGITVSAGIAVSPNHANNIEGLIAAADRGLYAAKSAGRNRIGTPPPQEVIGRTVAA
ncbi:MAG TPA: sensor domain-containing diguanylate cyclase [Thermoanaerobaculia bacterium]|jgi:diguanylate cyclase (GGDEF)-like protein|nr:sensor domain-containing diguanylate cyclase [Thermoanaerobaculia bacterium]